MIYQSLPRELSGQLDQRRVVFDPVVFEPESKVVLDYVAVSADAVAANSKLVLDYAAVSVNSKIVLD